MVELHKTLSETAIRLSVYSSVLDFGLMMSVLMFQRNFLPAGLTSSLIGLFDNAITYITVLIVGLFASAFILKHKEHVVKIYTNALYAPKMDFSKKIKVLSYLENPAVDNDRSAILKVPLALKMDDLALQHVVNSNNESFVRFNGVWYKTDKNGFEKVARPEYD